MNSGPHRSSLKDSLGWRLFYWLCQVIGWGTYSLAGIRVTAAQAGGNLPDGLVFGYALFFLYSIAVTHLFGRHIEKRNWLSLAPLQALTRIVLGALTVSVILASLVVVLGVLRGGLSLAMLQGNFLFYLWLNIAFGTAVWTAFFVTIAALFRNLHTRRRAEALEHAMTAARLKALESQISPHFLFNCLNSIRGMISENPETAQDMVTRLANLLRHSLQRETLSLLPLSRELEVVEDYLALEGVRFDERLTVTRLVAQDCLGAKVPAMTVQLLVENAVKHGISQLPAGGKITLLAERQGETLRIQISNTGRLGGAPRADSTRVGLQNLRERLTLLCGPETSLQVTQQSEDVVQATVLLPYKT